MLPLPRVSLLIDKMGRPSCSLSISQTGPVPYFRYLYCRIFCLVIVSVREFVFSA
jgi:hypothetical protein